MPRPRRIDYPGLIYHVTNRGVKRLPIFHDYTDRQEFIRFLYKTQNEFPFLVHSYCLMTNHYHLLIQTLEHSLSRTMQYFNSLFASWFNRKNKHSGHVFQGRFHSIPVQANGYFTRVSRYIHLNPIKAGIVALPEDYEWSNYGKLIRGQTDLVADPTRLLSYFGSEVTDNWVKRESYRRYVEENLKEPEMITEEVLLRMRSWGDLPDSPILQPAK